MLRYGITNRRRLGPEEAERADGLVEWAAGLAARGDIDYVQLREKELPPNELTALARRMIEALRANMTGSARRPKLLINSRADVAIAVRADGVHLTSSAGELTPEQVRALYSAAGLLPPVVSISCHTLADVIAARGLKSEDEFCVGPDPATAPDLILFGPVFEKRAGEQVVAEGSGLKLLRQACAAAAPIPVLALGGITEENANACLAAGATGIAAIRLFQRESSRQQAFS